MEKTRLCPLLYIKDGDLGDCREDDCAFFDTGYCSFKTIADHLLYIRNELRTLNTGIQNLQR